MDYDKMLAIVDKMFEEMSPEEFKRDLEEAERISGGRGITVEEFLNGKWEVEDGN